MFRSSPTLTVHSLRRHLTSSSGTRYILLILNGRDKIDTSKSWLDELSILKTSGVKFEAGAVVLGHEECLNQWIKPYLRSNHGPLSFLFIVYDWKSVDDVQIFQWPLGTNPNFPPLGTNPNFPPLDTQVEESVPRKYVCNFIRTESSTRMELVRMELVRIEQLVRMIERINLEYGNICYLRTEWEPNESIQSYILSSSDLTLSLGMNQECHRVYESISLGSIPVIEENSRLRSNCRPYRLLKQFNSPVMFVKNLTLELPAIIQQEMKMTPHEKVERRKKTILWYQNFNRKIREKLISVIKQTFYLQPS